MEMVVPFGLRIIFTQFVNMGECVGHSGLKTRPCELSYVRLQPEMRKLGSKPNPSWQKRKRTCCLVLNLKSTSCSWCVCFKYNLSRSSNWYKVRRCLGSTVFQVLHDGGLEVKTRQFNHSPPFLRQMSNFQSALINQRFHSQNPSTFSWRKFYLNWITVSMSPRCLNRQSVGWFPLKRIGPPIPSGEVYWKIKIKIQLLWPIHQIHLERKCICSNSPEGNNINCSCQTVISSLLCSFGLWP